jgi:hypothetical protein
VKAYLLREGSIICNENGLWGIGESKPLKLD